MSDDVKTNGLHLPSLSIHGFRGVSHLDMERLGRVTLLAGRNAVGKTTVLDAVRIYAERGDLPALHHVLLRHEEIETRPDDDEGFDERPVFDALFSGRHPALQSSFTIGPADNKQQLCVKIVPADELSQQQMELFQRRGVPSKSPMLQISYDDHVEIEPVFDEEYATYHPMSIRSWRMRRSVSDTEWPESAACVFLGPGLPGTRQTAAHWDEVALTPSEPLALDALRLACGADITGAAAVARPRESHGRRIVVGFADGERVPLRSLGDGAARLFGLAVAFSNAANGFLLIDEAENGIHHSLQSDYWRLVFQAAADHNVQVLATTHSWDCIAGFARAACEDEHAEGIAIRLEPDDANGGVRSIEYAEDDLAIAADQGIEVR